jgi:hypothetical protein
MELARALMLVSLTLGLDCTLNFYAVTARRPLSRPP